MEKIIENINCVLAEWNPIGVDKTIAKDEYRGYIPKILRNIDDEQKLLNCLKDILINKLEIGYDPKNHKHFDDLQNVCRRMMQTYKLTNDSNL